LKFNTAGAGPGANDPRRGGAQPNAQRRNDAPSSRNDTQGNKVKPAQPGGGAQLFDLSNDLGETKNLATEKPEKLKEMQELLAKIRGQ